MGKSWPWPAQGWAAGILVRLRFCLSCGLVQDLFERPAQLFIMVYFIPDVFRIRQQQIGFAPLVGTAEIPLLG